MLNLSHISKQYRTGELVQQALDDVSLCLRDHEFVSILGPSGSGKTTLLNVIGGLDHCDSGELTINGTPTSAYKDHDWDAYRNHTIGFVFQSYNLIPHQSVLANVELALTIGGVTGAERRRRAEQALADVGLADHLHKKPGQLSGGQMQRVAVARALVNDPAILLADEPTGALDSETSVQIMELLKQVAETRLVVMVTHNAELAGQYSTRIIRLKDGKITADTRPCDAGGAPPTHTAHSAGRAKMSFGTSLSLSFQNLWTKKGRTILTAFAGSIGIIGIALILALSGGVNNYIDDIQKSTMASYPITIQERALDMAGAMGTRNGLIHGAYNSSGGERDAVYADTSRLSFEEAMSANIRENDLTAFKRYLDDPASEIHGYLGENGVVYGYDVHFSVYSYDADGALISTDADTDAAGASSLSGGGSGAAGDPMTAMQRMTSVLGGSDGGTENFTELMPGADGGTVSPVVTENYELLYGAWPARYDEVILVLDENNAVDAGRLYQLGLLTSAEYRELTEQARDGEKPDEMIWDYAETCGHTFYLLPACDLYTQGADSTFAQAGDGAVEIETLLDNALALKITGVIRPAREAENANLAAPVAYTHLLTEYVIDYTDASAVVRAQEETPETNVLNGMPFEAVDDDVKVQAAKEYIGALGVSDKASFYRMAQYLSAQAASGDEAPTEQAASGIPQAAPGEINPQAMPGADGQALPTGAMVGMGAAMDETTQAAAMDRWLNETPDESLLLTVYDKYIAVGSYVDNMEAFGKVSTDAPASISLYTDSFEAKESVSACIERYNEGATEADRITYTDYVALLTGSVSSIVDVISYVLIAFVAVSLIVSSIMIGIITHISVLERTREIGILRAMGASKHNVSQVFNAETVIVGLLAGVIGVGVSALLTIPVNALLRTLLGNTGLSASLPAAAAAALVALSAAITVIAGLIPARGAARKDPVAALRAE